MEKCELVFFGGMGRGESSQQRSGITLYSEIIPGRHERPHGMPGIETRLVTSKARAYSLYYCSGPSELSFKTNLYDNNVNILHILKNI